MEMKVWVRFLAATALAVALVAMQPASVSTQSVPQRLVTGPNINMIAGTGPDGDWTLQRQNEPAIACSSRNSLHCLGAGNDYRSVDIAFSPDANRVVGDSWLGLHSSNDGGLTWRSRLLPGFPQDTTPSGLASPLHGYTTGSDPVVRSGANGLFFFSGIVFNRQPGGASAVFVSRFIDNNNQEGRDGEPVAAIDTQVLDAMPDGPEGARFIDKPWIAVDVPRPGAPTCTVGGTAQVPRQSFPCSRVYLAYAIVEGSGAAQTSTVMFTSSADGGATWARPRPISLPPDPDLNNDGVVTIEDVDIVRAGFGRRCAEPSFNPDADATRDCVVNVLDLAFVSRSFGAVIPRPQVLHQGAAVAVSPVNGDVYVAWRQFRTGTDVDGFAVARSTSAGAQFVAPQRLPATAPFDQPNNATAFRSNGYASMTIDGTGRAYVSWAARGYSRARPDPRTGDARIVLTSSLNGVDWTMPMAVDNRDVPGHQLMPSVTTAGGRLSLIYYDLTETKSGLFAPYIDELPIELGPAPRVRDTAEVRAGQAEPGPSPQFETVKITSFAMGAARGAQGLRELQFNPPNLPLFRQGTARFMGDYLDASPVESIVATGTGGWMFNTGAPYSSAFHAVWADNRDVLPPADGNWQNYTPPNPESFTRPTISGFDPSQVVPVCVPGQAGMRNQNLYTARVSPGLVVGAVGTAKPSGGLTRAFPVLLQNQTATVRSYRLTLAPAAANAASLAQFRSLALLDVRIPARSTVARTVFMRRGPTTSVRVEVAEIVAPGGAVVPNGQRGAVLLNPDPSNPDIENPDIENPDIENPDIENPDIENPDIENPDIENVEVHNPDIENPRVTVPLTPGVTAPDIENPDIENPDIENTRVANPSVITLDAAAPDIENPDIENPDIENPDIENRQYANGALTDTTWVITNRGNTATAYTLKLALKTPMPAGFRSQLIVYKAYQTPTVRGCSLLPAVRNILLSNVPNPQFVLPDQLATPDIENPDIENVALALAPGESARATLRVFDPDRSDSVVFFAAASVTPAVVSQAVNTVDEIAGNLTPPVAMPLITSARLPIGTLGAAYSATLGASTAGLWTVVGGALPPGLGLNAATGVISGTPGAAGTFSFVLKFTTPAGASDFLAHTILIETVATPRVFVVGNANDSGVGSLRDAITAANLHAGALDTISFNVPGPGPVVIRPLSPLPAITDPIVIDGTTQPDYAGSPRVEIDGASTSGDGLRILATDSLIRGLAIRHFSGAGITVTGAGRRVRIESNYLGLDTAGALSGTNGPYGIVIESPDNIIGGVAATARNVIAGHTFAGVEIAGPGTSIGNLIQGNYIGTNPTGTVALANHYGVHLQVAASNIVRGNLIAGNSSWGIVVLDPASRSNVLVGNIIGLDISGAAALPNGGAGIIFANAGSNTVGGTSPADRNVISGNLGSGIDVSGAGSSANRILGNYIGVDASGTLARGNHGDGITVNGADDTVIGIPAVGGGNVISANFSVGVRITATRTAIAGNYIGTNATGTAALGNGLAGPAPGSGIAVGGPNNTIGGNTPLHRNVISGNGNIGINLFGATVTNNVVAGNYIGTNATGTAAIANAVGGVQAASGAANNRIGGAAEEGNVVSGNQGPGISITADSAGTIVQSNRIGVSADGTVAVANTGDGIRAASANNRIGGDATTGNVISGNGGTGVSLTGTGNRLESNRIGTDPTGTLAVPNVGGGVAITLTASNNQIGTSPTTGNVIAHNGVAGVRIPNTGTGNSIRWNSIFSNADLGIDLGNAGVTPNDPGDTDAGANGLQNAPVLTSAIVSGPSTAVSGSLDSQGGATYVIQFFASPACNASGIGDGATFLGETSVTTAASGNATIGVVLPLVGVGQVLTATATDANGNTSEFSGCRVVTP